MYRLVIADDEKTIRESIARLIDWKSLDIEVVAVCKNGNEAYDAILDEYPDIVLTDIRMPGMSGLEMIQRLSEVGGAVEFIILSGYGEFEYAKKAMELGVQHFLLKPCNENEIIRVIKETKLVVDRKRKLLELSTQQYRVKNDVFSSRIWTMLEGALSAACSADPFAPFSDYLLQRQQPFCLCQYPHTPNSSGETALVRDCHDNFPDRSLCRLQTQHHHCLLLEATEAETAGLCARYGCSAQNKAFSSLSEALTYLLCLIQEHGECGVLVNEVLLPLKGSVSTPQAEKIIDDMKHSVSGTTTSNRVVDKTLQYMQQHLSDPDISLKNIAETYLFMNVDYVSKQFVKFTGKRFSAYLNELKIEKAKQLLSADPNTKISAVAEAVGCANNPQYFNYIFKKLTGMTPSAFQQSLMP